MERMMSASDMPWAANQPDNAGNQEHCVVVFSSEYQLNDATCDLLRRFVCQALGENVALGRPAWMSTNRGAPPSHGTDGLLVEAVRTSALFETKEQLWTVDLGMQHQVIGFLYAAPMAENKVHKRNTKVYVSSEPLPNDSDVLCRHLTVRLLLEWMARYYACDFPVQGRYLHVTRKAGLRVVMSELMVFGHPIYES
ncbi:hypothetical protein FJT64_007106 [Amphibalanus amphitrite]|uniref:C-type lectin domain-containing protein n=1 Tax=Amphibalanus amphitrite TaxID=1232801 RepID=A0A6A4VNU9_AMPAM|nr:hypothetical protein FJT64_007106 [Amphibalanus amphitrite]